MGAVLSLAGPRCRTRDYIETSNNESCKKQKLSPSFDEDSQRLIPSLPDELSIQILARLPRIHYFNLRLVSRKWKATVTSHELFKVRQELGMREEWLYILTKIEDDILFWHALDPLSRKWQRLPPLPNVIHEEESKKGSSGLWMWNMVGSSIKIAEIVRGWLGWKDTLDQMLFCGCAIGAVDGCLYVLGGFSRSSTMRCVWRYDPIVNAWSEVTSMSVGRAYCKTGILNNKLYVVGGVSRGRGGLTPLQSAEVFDPCTGTWSQVPSMPFSKAQVLPNAFFADMLKPIATGMTSYMGRLFVPQSLYSWPFFVDVGGEIYDPNTNSWAEMPNGMGDGWPARQAGTKLSVVVDGELYAFDPSSSLDSGKIKVYDRKEDAWKVVIRKVPVRDLTDSESPYLLAGFHGKLHVITKDANRNISILRADPRDNLGSMSSSSVSHSADSLHEHSDSPAESDTVVWKAIATRNFGSAELVNCQVLDI
ncbi:F-box/kelch-repeat protein [Melia azedarach]|uniref:F-box/kelch-repeat protein n=1 Tax=Melia azedarach TaxID=155640 RepID=A0ACC1WQM8_MELAZ|nr:F-box/kelch-repeat protein [Melia azedarach]